MSKKECDRNSWYCKKAQITVFMIMGLLLLFAFLFLLMLTKSLQKTELEDLQESVTSDIFRKEALRIYIDGCLFEGLQQGLVLAGEQGRITHDHNGVKIPETRTFVNQETGTEFTGKNVFYGITDQEYVDYPNAYPCNTEQENPDFCQYSYPNTSINFGNLKLGKSKIVDDLEKYLRYHVTDCVEKLIKQNVSQAIQFEQTDVRLGVELFRDTIQVKVGYPLKFNLGNSNYFYLSNFNFFYQSEFEKFIYATLLYPLSHEQKYWEFDYENDLTKDSFFYYTKLSQGDCENVGDGHFKCSKSTRLDDYLSLGVNFDPQLDLVTGDKVYTFTTETARIVQSPQPYSYSIAVQNRAPALDYVNRATCSEADYDYLVVPGDPELGDINITLLAHDPDAINEEIVYSFGVDQSGYDENEYDQDLIDVDWNENELNLVAPEEGKYKLVVSARDQYGKSDLQLVRVKVEKPVDVELSLIDPGYKIINSEGVIVPYQSMFDDENLRGFYFVSKEDPVFINVEAPETEGFSVTVDQEIIMIDDSGDYNFPADTNDLKCLDPPCFNKYDFDKIIFQKNYYENYPFAITTTNNDWVELRAASSDQFCDVNVGDEAKLNVHVKACIPHRNQEYPFPYIPETTLYQLHGCINKSDPNTCSRNPNTNPFLANHSCCIGDADTPGNWKVAESETVCYTAQDELGCFGNGYTMQKRKGTAYCDGERGNVCGDIDFDFEEQNFCGNSTYDNCQKVAPECENLELGYLSDGFWCHGTYGCGQENQACKEIIISKANLPFNVNTALQIAQYECTGCSQEYVDKSCYNLEEGKAGTCVKEESLFGFRVKYECQLEN